MDLTDKSLGFTSKRIEALHRLNLYTVEDLLSYYPIHYDVLNANSFDDWKLKDRVTFEGEIISKITHFRKGRLTISSFEVQTLEHNLKVTIFNRPWVRNLIMGQTVTITGIYNGNGKVTAINYDTKPLAEHDAVTPVYSTREGIQQRTIRDSIKKVYTIQENEIQDVIPESLIQKYHLLRKYLALRKVHFPETQEDVQKAYRTLKYEEFLRFFVAIQLMKSEDGNGIYKQPRNVDVQAIQEFIEHLSFSLTPDQRKSIDEIVRDLSSNHTMYRLIQGDVGCGKTIVAIITLYACFTSGYQGALLAPTEILAQQHYVNLKQMLEPYGVHIGLLYSGLSSHDKNEVLSQLKDGSINIIVGTHSLFQDDVVFHSLGCVVADEQQRFGVEQRKKLKDKGVLVDFLLMSATPIPRTLASTLFGDMDISTIETLPSGRKEPITKYIPENSFRTVLDDVNQLLDTGKQLYVICAAVDENEEYHARDVVATTNNLQKLFQNYRVGMLHGRMSSSEKQEVMDAFARNEIQVLVSTTVVEVGMNVVNATGMIIYDADRFGLSQLHQLRGRIQRGSSIGQCWLLSDSQDEKVHDRLNVLVRSNNGFEISYEDLRMRGPGDILGTRQSGVPNFVLGNLVEDTSIIETARKDAVMIIENPDTLDYAMIFDWVKTHNARNGTFVD